MRAPSRAAWLMVPEMLKARPNQKIENSNRNRTGNTKAASTISAPAFPSNRANRTVHSMAGEAPTPRPVPVEEAEFMPSKRPPWLARSIKQNGNCCRHAEGDFDRLRIFESQLGVGQMQRKECYCHVAQIAECLPEPPLPNDHANGHEAIDQKRN